MRALTPGWRKFWRGEKGPLPRAGPPNGIRFVGIYSVDRGFSVDLTPSSPFVLSAPATQIVAPEFATRAISAFNFPISLDCFSFALLSWSATFDVIASINA